jgi:hypothetical protein
MTEAVEAFTPEDIEAAINYRNPAGPIWQIKNGKIRFYLMNMDRMALDDMLSRPLASQQDWDMLKKQIKKQLQDSQGTMDEDMLSPGQKKIAKMSPPPNKIDANDLAALRAGKKKKSEGNAFSGAVAKAKATGADEFKVGGKEYKVQEGIEDTLQNILPKSMQPFNTETAAKNAAAAKASRAQAPVKEGFPTVDDAKKRMDAKAGKTVHGTKTVTKTGVKHERNYDADEPTGERGRPKKDKFAK